MAHRERWFGVFENLLCYSRLPKAERQSLAGLRRCRALLTRFNLNESQANRPACLGTDVRMST